MKHVLAAVTCALVLSPAWPPLAAQTKPLVIQKVIVKVNGEIFTLTELTQRQIQALRDQQKQVTPETLQNDSALRKAVEDVTPMILTEAVDELLLVQRGRELGVKFTDEQFKQAIENIKKENKLDDVGLARALQQEGLTLQELRQNFERSYLMRAVQQQEIAPAMSITDEEKRQYYSAHTDEFRTQATVTIRELLVLVPVSPQGINVAADEAAKAKIETARERANKGEDFAKIVAELSDSGSKANGGLISGVVVEELLPAVAAAVGKLKPGEISETLRNEKGYVIFKLEARTEAEPLPLEKVRDAITQRIYETRLDGETKKFLDKLRAQALIEWKDDGYKQMYEKARSAKAGG
jgi:peptidyl-prolyl cis-trans isomerase SurA